MFIKTYVVTFDMCSFLIEHKIIIIIECSCFIPFMLES